MDYLGSNWNVESLSERELVDIHAKLIKYSTAGNCYKTSTLLKEYGSKVIDLGCAVAVSMPGDKDECAKHAMILLSHFIEEDALAYDEQYSFYIAALRQAHPEPYRLSELR
jgi:hypothetical protein